MVAVLAESTVVSAVVFGAVRAFVALNFNPTLSVLLPAVLLLVIIFGVTLFIGGLTLVWKRIPMVIEYSGRKRDHTVGTGGLVLLLIITALYLSAGILAFSICERIAKRGGSLSRY